MALLFSAPISSISSPSTSSPGPASHTVIRLCHKSISLLLKTKNHVGGIVHVSFTPNDRGAVVVKATSDANAAGQTGPEAPAAPSSDSKEKSVPIENLPLESKLQALNDQRMKMKLAKKIRLRRKRLVRKRHLRKKGRWPPSKMKKNKNV